MTKEKFIKKYNNHPDFLDDLEELINRVEIMTEARIDAARRDNENIHGVSERHYECSKCGNRIATTFYASKPPVCVMPDNNRTSGICGGIHVLVGGKFYAH